MLGSMPPLRALSSYCLALASAMARYGTVEFISFKEIYPRMLYPGGNLRDDHTFPALDSPALTVRRKLTWCNPLTWVSEGLLTRAPLLHAQWWSLPLGLVYLFVCGGFKLRRRPVVYTVHNVLPHDASPLFINVSRLLFRLGDHFIVHTDRNKRQLMDHYNIPGSRISLIPHGLLDFHVRSDADRATIREEMGFRPTDKVILLFGAIRPYKGVDTALEAFSRVHAAVPRARLLIAGKLWEDWAPYAKRIEALNIRKAVVASLDYIPSGEVHRYFTASDLVLLPYRRFDSQSGVGATAVSFRKPLIVSNVGGLPNLVADPRCVTPPGDSAALAKAVEDCLASPKRLDAMTADAEAIASTLSWPAIARKTWAVYDHVLGRAGR